MFDPQAQLEISQIDNSTGEAAFAHNTQSGRPWHNLGKAVPGAMTVQEALKLGGCDFIAEKRRICTADDDKVGDPDHSMVIRLDTMKSLGVVGSRYKVVQMKDALDFFDDAIGEGAAAIDTVGMMNKGRTGFLLAKLPECVEIVPGDVVEKYLLFSNSFDGSSPIMCLFTGTRVVCQNSLHAAIKGSKNAVRIRHTKNAKHRLKLVKHILNENESYWQRLTAALRYFQKRDVTRKEVEAFTEALFPGKEQEDGTFTVSTRTENRRSEVVEAFETSPGYTFAGKSAYGLYNAVTYLIDHETSIRKGTDRWEQSITGSGEKLRQNAFNLLTKMFA